MFCGYNTVHYKVAIFTLSAVLCGIAGALYVPQVGIINPSEMSPANSIEIAIWVAVGGRGTLAGAMLGAGLVNGAKSFFTVAFPEYWLFALGAIFIAVTLFMPRGAWPPAEKMKVATLPEVQAEHGTVLYLDGISVSFDGFKALDNLSLAIDAGELRCVIGPNGAGKTTMMDVITGKTRPDEGARCSARPPT